MTKEFRSGTFKEGTSSLGSAEKFNGIESDSVLKRSENSTVINVNSDTL